MAGFFVYGFQRTLWELSLLAIRLDAVHFRSSSAVSRASSAPTRMCAGMESHQLSEQPQSLSRRRPCSNGRAARSSARLRFVSAAPGNHLFSDPCCTCTEGQDLDCPTHSSYGCNHPVRNPTLACRQQVSLLSSWPLRFFREANLCSAKHTDSLFPESRRKLPYLSNPALIRKKARHSLKWRAFSSPALLTVFSVRNARPACQANSRFSARSLLVARSCAVASGGRGVPGWPLDGGRPEGVDGFVRL